MSDYKVKINKEVLSEFFTLPPNQIKQIHYNEVNKVINIVLIKHYSKYYQLFEDLRSFALVAICARRESYNASYSPYNYCYTVFRNEIGNKIVKYTKELLVPEIRESISTARSYIEAELDAPKEIEEFVPYLTASKNFDLYRVPKKLVVPLLVFILSVEKVKVKVPDFVADIQNNVQILYKIIQEIFNNYE